MIASSDACSDVPPLRGRAFVSLESACIVAQAVGFHGQSARMRYGSGVARDGGAGGSLTRACMRAWMFQERMDVPGRTCNTAAFHGVPETMVKTRVRVVVQARLGDGGTGGVRTCMLTRVQGFSRTVPLGASCIVGFSV